MEFELDDGAGGSTTHYGFLELTVFGPGTATPYAIELTGFAYETTPDLPITTFPIPEPATGLLLMVGLAMAAMSKRNRRRVLR